MSIFSDEIQRIFDWMSKRKRDFFPKEFKVATMRTWDNFFWWLEVTQLPLGGIVEPSDWPPPRGTQAVRIEGSIKGNSLSITSGAGKSIVWLSPEMVDFTKPIRIRLNGKPFNVGQNLKVTPEPEVLLEDVRTRGERLHPFWAKVE